MDERGCKAIVYGLFALHLSSEKTNMNRIFTLLLALTFGVLAEAQSTASVTVTEAIQMKETGYDFGKIPQGKPVYHSFEIVNISDKPVSLVNIQTSCGCTTPEWSKDPIAPGASTQVKVGFNAASEGFFEKYITILYNQNQTKQVKISGTVWRAPEGPAPLNASVQLLKQKNQ
jgi:hypothetical protein